MDHIKDIDNVEVSKKKKKKHKALWITLGVILLLLITPIAVIYGCFYDGTITEMGEIESLDKEKFMMDAAVDSLDNTKDTGKITISISEEKLTQLLRTAFNEVSDSITDINLKNYITNIELVTSEEDWRFVVHARYENIFKTKVTIITKIYRNEEISAFEFDIKDVKVGRIEGLYTPVKNIASKYFNFDTDEFISDMVKQTGLSFEYSPESKKIIYTDEAINADIMKYLNNGDDDIYNTILRELFDPQAFKLILNKDGITGEIDLAHLSKNAQFQDDSKKVDYGLLNFNSQVASLIGNKIIDSTQTKNMYNYLVGGYAKASTSLKEALEGKDLTSVGISDYTKYNGVIPNVSNDYLKKTIEEQATLTNITTNNEIGRLTEENINHFINATNIIGYSYFMEREVDENTYKVNTLTIDNFYANIIENNLMLVIGVSINGYETLICIDMAYKECDSLNYNLTFDISEMYFGEDVASDKLKSNVYSLVEKALENDETLFFDKETTTLTINILNSISAEAKAVIDATGGMEFEMSGKSLNDDGELIFKVKSV